jgi:hypothetical protein
LSFLYAFSLSQYASESLQPCTYLLLVVFPKMDFQS